MQRVTHECLSGEILDFMSGTGTNNKKIGYRYANISNVNKIPSLLIYRCSISLQRTDTDPFLIKLF